MAYNNGFPIGYQPVQPMQYTVVPQQQPQIIQQQPQQQPQQVQQIPQVQQAPPQQPAQGGINWVQGEAGAKSHLVGPNQSVMLMDSEESCFYIKSADASGMPLPLRIFDYKERIAPAQQIPAQQAQPAKQEQVQPPEEKVPEIDLSMYMTKDEFDERVKSLLEQIDDLTLQLAEMAEHDTNGKRRK